RRRARHHSQSRRRAAPARQAGSAPRRGGAGRRRTAMNCPSPLARSMYADGALPAGEAAALERHAAACPACGAGLEALVEERRVRTAALRHEDSPVQVPAFRPAGRGLRPLWSAALAALLAAGPLSIWAAITNIDLPAALAWLNPFSVDR